jgi:hypothetical protein
VLDNGLAIGQSARVPIATPRISAVSNRWRLPLLASLLVAIIACGSEGSATRDTTEQTSATTTTSITDPGIAVWSLQSREAVTSTAQSFTAQVNRLDCNDGVTGTVLPPVIEMGSAEIVVTFSVEPTLPGDHTCPGNNQVSFSVSLSETIGQRSLVDGACRSDEARTTSFCVDGATRWQP